jgi:hypothetical protein
MQNPVNLLWQVATIALIVIATRWLFSARGTSVPIERGGDSLYRVKTQWRAVGVLASAFCAVLAAKSFGDLPSASSWVSLAIFLPLVAAGLWIATGVVTINESGISKKILWYSKSIYWKDVTQLRIYRKQGGAIEVRSSSKKLIVDARINAFDHLLKQVLEHADLQCAAEDLYVRR